MLFVARAVNSRCVNDNDCGGSMRCEGQRCQCNADQRAEDGEDVYGRPIQRCISDGQIRSTTPIDESTSLVFSRSNCVDDQFDADADRHDQLSTLSPLNDRSMAAK